MSREPKLKKKRGVCKNCDEYFTYQPYWKEQVNTRCEDCERDPYRLRKRCMIDKCKNAPYVLHEKRALCFSHYQESESKPIRYRSNNTFYFGK